MSKEKTPFGTALEFFLRNTTATQKKLATFVGTSQGYISDLKKGEKHGSEELRRKVAQYFKKEYQEFLDIGKNVLSKEIEARSIVGEDISWHIGTPTPIDPSNEVIQEVLRERGEKMTPEIALRIAKVMTIILEDDEEKEELIESAADKETAKDFYSLISDLEVLSTKDYYKYYGEIKGLVISLKREEKTSNGSDE